jgi:hypothetical protein
MGHAVVGTVGAPVRAVMAEGCARVVEVWMMVRRRRTTGQENGVAQVMELIGGRWQRRRLRAFQNERELQDLIVADPSLVPGCAGAAAVDELPVPGVGSLDIALVDELGVLTLVECKLRANPQIRREVVGQILAYASGLRGLSVDELARLWVRGSGTGEGLFADVKARATTGYNEEEFRSRVADSLSSGAFRLVVAVDEITDELRAIIEFLAGHLDGAVKIMALEVGLIAEGNLKLLVLETYGQTFEPPQSSTGATKKRWGRDEVEAAVDALSAPQREFVKVLLAHADTNRARFNGGVGQAPSAGFYYDVEARTPSLWSLYVRPSGPVVALNIGSVANASAEAGEKYRNQVNAAASTAIGQRVESLKAYPEIEVQTLIDTGVSANTLGHIFDSLTHVVTHGDDDPAVEDEGSTVESTRPVTPAAFDRRISCAECGATATRVALVSPSSEADRWRFIYEGVVAGNGSHGDPVSEERAELLTRVFGEATPTMEGVNRVQLYDDAGFCRDCGLPFCDVHWQGSEHGGGTCPNGHWKSLDPHWHPE